VPPADIMPSISRLATEQSTPEVAAILSNCAKSREEIKKSVSKFLFTFFFFAFFDFYDGKPVDLTSAERWAYSRSGVLR
jgi:hypothetical protein